MSNVNIIPQSRFTGLHKGIENVYFGVPQRDPVYIHHFRSGRSITNIDKLLESKTSNVLEKYQGRFLYFGAFDYHYGHFISECLGRTWASAALDYDEIIWLPTFHPSLGYNWITEIPPWQNAILSYLGISNNKTHFLTNTAKISTLIVPESGSWLYTTPKNYMLEFLKFRQSEYFNSLGEITNIKRNIFIARSTQFSGRIKYIETLYDNISSHGYQIIFPEQLTFDQQMNLYRNAENLIFEAGSAIHTLELFATLQANVAILPRSKSGSTAFKRVLAPRVKKVWNYTGEIVSGNERASRNSDIQVDLDKLLDWLHEGEFI